MADLATVWAETLPKIRNGVTGVGVWTALNASKPVAVENGFIVLGLSTSDFELAGHLRMPQTKKLIESEIGAILGQSLELRVIEGGEASDWDRAKRRDEEAKRLQNAALERARAEATARTNWDHVYETLSRKYASIQNKSNPVQRAKFYQDATAFLAEARKNQGSFDDLSERNFARCVERLAQYSEIGSTLVALAVLQSAGEI